MPDPTAKPKILFFASPKLMERTRPIRAVIDFQHYQLMLVNANGTSLHAALVQDKYDLAIVVDAPLVHFANILIMRDRKESQTPILYLDTVFLKDFSMPERWLWYLYYREHPEYFKELMEKILSETQGKTLPY